MKKLLITLNKCIMLVMFLSLAFLVSCGDDEASNPVPPTTTTGGGTGDATGGAVDPSTPIAFFTAQVDAENSLTYAFTNGSQVNGITDTSFESSWDFGGDGTSTDANPTYTFSEEGTYDVELTITAADGVTDVTNETIEVTAPKNRYAVITDLSPDDTGELRLNLDSIKVGRMSFMYRVAEGPGMEIADGFINVTGSSTSGRNSIVEVRFKDDAAHGFREGASDETIANANFPEGVVEEWVPVEISWSADGVTAPSYSVFIGGQTVIEDAVSVTRDLNNEEQVEEHLLANIDGPHNFQWKYNSTDNVSDGVYHVDDILIFSSDSGSEVEVFSDNFQGRVAGDDLHPGEDAATPYHSNTSEATVGEDQ